MKHLLIVLAIVAAAGTPLYWALTAGTFGVSGQSPLGEYARVEEFLVEGGLDKLRLGEGSGLSKETGGPDGAEFAHTRLNSKESPHWARVLHDPAGRILSVRVQFFSGDDEMDHPRTRLEAFAGRLWMETARIPPFFVNEARGEGRKLEMFRIAEFNVDGVRGRWSKRYQALQDKRSICDVVTFDYR